MKHKSLILNILTRIIFIIINVFMLVYTYYNIKNEYIFIIINLLGLLVIQIVLLIRYFLKINSDIALFFDAIASNDSSLLFDSNNKSLLISNYNTFLKKINDLVSDKNQEIIKQKLFLEAIFNNAQVGFITFDTNGRIDTFNKSAEKLLKLSKPNNISHLIKVHPKLPGIIKNLDPSTSSTLRLNLPSDEHPDILEAKVISFKKSIFTINKSQIHLISFNDIKNELENNEMEAWQRLIRVFTHEIMNSISPVISLTSAINSYLANISNSINDQDGEKYLKKTEKGVKTIELTASALLHFVEQYRNLTLLPKPTLIDFKLIDLFEDLKTLFEQDLQNKNIEFRLSLADNTSTLSADYNMIRLVLINLIKNSVTAVENVNNASITINHFTNNKNQNIIQVIDNGKGIASDVIDKIFIPFYTTKETLPDGKAGGTGIGLSLSKQILRLHSGDITVKSIVNDSTIFSIII